ncbi:MAG: iron-containing redox enzyme family protein [Acidimicrobiales bacterium]
MLDAPELPLPRGPVSEDIIEVLRRSPSLVPSAPFLNGDTLDEEDLQLALYVCYELHYRGWAGVDPAWEWDAGLLARRAELEDAFLFRLRAALEPTPTASPAATVVALRDLVATGGAPSVSRYAEEHATIEQLRELAIHRSPYQLKEADPHTWAIPRLPAGRAKSAMLGLQFDEYGDAVPGRSHAELFAETMRALDLDPTYGHYLDVVPGVVLATVNLVSLFGLHREHVGACIGHLAVFEMTSVVPMGRYSRAMRRVVGSERGAEFYDVHVLADAEHQRIAINELVPGLLEADPSLGPDLLFGAAALMHLERRVAEHIIGCWESDSCSLHSTLALAGL